MLAFWNGKILARKTRIKDQAISHCLLCSKLKDTLKAFNDFKNKQQKWMKKYFLMCKSIYILKVYSIHYTLRLNTNVSFGQNRRYKKSLFFLLQAPTHHSFTFNLRFLYDLKHKVSFSKTYSKLYSRTKYDDKKNKPSFILKNAKIDSIVMFPQQTLLPETCMSKHRVE